jgi:rSAM/selenodomain-associated transferase 1
VGGGEHRAGARLIPGRVPEEMTPRPFAFVLYARVPRRGAVKTRLTPWLDPDEALALHLALLEDSLDLLRDATLRAGAVPWIAFSEPWEPPASGRWESLSRAAGSASLLPQREGDLGARLRHTCDELFDRRHAGVVILGSDSPTLPPAYLERAQSVLQGGADVAIGPTEDGGYYLIGLGRRLPQLFDGISWGTDAVFAQTCATAERLGARVAPLSPWHDIDRPGDLARLYRDQGAGGAPRAAAFAASLARAGRLPDPA